MIRRLTILLLIVGCASNPKTSPSEGGWLEKDDRMPAMSYQYQLAQSQINSKEPAVRF